MFYTRTFGIDIRDHTIQLLELDSRRNVVSYSSHRLPPGVVKDGVVSGHDILVMACKTLLTEAKPKPIESNFTTLRALVSLPASVIWSHTTTIPKELPIAEHDSYVREAMQKIIPVDLKQCVSTLYTTSLRDTQFATYCAVERRVYESYVAALTEAGFVVEFIGSAVHALARAVLPPSFGNDNYLVVDVKDRHVTLGTFDEHAIAYSVVQNQTTEYGTHDINQLQADIKAAEAYFKTATGESITKILLTGPEKLSDISNSLSHMLTTPVTVGDPYTRLKDNTLLREVTPPVSLATVVGLSLYGINRSVPHMNLLERPASYSRGWFVKVFHTPIKVTPETLRQTFLQVRLPRLLTISEHEQRMLILLGICAALGLTYVVLVS